MRIAFLVDRKNHYRNYGTVIETALQRGHTVELWLGLFMDEDNSKYYLQPSSDTVPDFGGGGLVLREYRSPDDLSGMVQTYEPDVIISILHPPKSLLLEDRSFLFVTLQYGIDTIFHSSQLSIEHTDLICVYTSWWVDWYAEYLAQRDACEPAWIEANIKNKCVATGFPQLDLFEKIDPVEVKQAFNIPAEQPVVLYLPLGVEFWPGAWSKFLTAPSLIIKLRYLWRGAQEEGIQFFLKYFSWILRGWNDVALHLAIRKFAENNGALFLAKGREKEEFRQSIENAMHLGVYDQKYYPPTSLALISIADLVIHSYSTAVLEAAYMGVPSITIQRPNLDLLVHKLWRRDQQGSAFHYSGMSHLLSIPEIIGSLSDTSLNDWQINEKKQRNFLDQYTGPNDHKAGERVLQAIELKMGL